MAIKKYLYREDEEVFNKIELTRQKMMNEIEGKKFSFKDAMTRLINKGYGADTPIPHPAEEPKE
jgi:hypothetical protein